ncbi:hypothetical protein ACFQ2Y_08640 [Streptomyces malaysiensis subsp. malaysiensis]
MVRALAVVGFSLPATDLAWLTGHEPEPIGQVLAALTGAGLMDEGAFRQEAARLSVLNDTPALTRRTLHQRAARLLHDQGRPATTIARHLVRAGRIPDSWSPELLLEVAEQVAVGEEASVAVDLLEQSLEQCPHQERRAALQAKLAEAEWKINPSTATRHHTPLYGAVRAGRLGLPDSVTLLMQLLWKGGLTEVEGLLAHLREDPAATDQLHAIEAALTCTYPWLAERRRPRRTTVAPPRRGRRCGRGPAPYWRTCSPAGRPMTPSGGPRRCCANSSSATTRRARSRPGCSPCSRWSTAAGSTWRPHGARGRSARPARGRTSRCGRRCWRRPGRRSRCAEVTSPRPRSGPGPPSPTPPPAPGVSRSGCRSAP